MEVKKTIFSMILGFLAVFFKKYILIFILVFCGIILDCITGLIKAKATGKGISSEKSTNGFWKKTGFIMAFGFGVFLDAFIPVALDIISIELPFSSPFGMVIGTYIVLNESISISENLMEINPKSVPRWLCGLLKNTALKIDEGEEK